MSHHTKKANSIEDAFKRAISKDSMAAKTAEPPGMAGKVEALEAAVLKMRGEFKMFRHETGVELSRLDEFEDRMDFLTQEVQFDGEDAYSQEDLTLSELMTGGASRRPIVGKKLAKAAGQLEAMEATESSDYAGNTFQPKSDQELIDILQSQVASLTSALELVTERCEALEQAAKTSPLAPPPSSQTDSLAALLSRVTALESSSAASTNTTAAASSAASSAAAAACSASSAAASAPTPSAHAAVASTVGGSGPKLAEQAKKKNKAKDTRVPVPSPSVSPPPAVSASAPAEPVPGEVADATSGPSWAEVAKKKKMGPLTPELIKNSPDPVRLLLSSGHYDRTITSEVMMTQAVIPLSINFWLRGAHILRGGRSSN